MDDWLKSLPSEAETMALMRDLTAVRQMGGFQLVKWISNSRSVMESIDVEKKSQRSERIGLRQRQSPC